MTAASWVGPAIVAAVISAMVTGFGWYVSERQASRREATRRRERVVDVQTAILAEIRAGRHRIGDLSHLRAELDALTAQPSYDLFVPRPVPTFVLDATLPDIHILPEAVIDPVVLYYRQAAAVALFVEDLRSDKFERLNSPKKTAMYRDYIDLLSYEDTLAAEAMDAISRSLNISGAARSDPRSAAGPDAASAQAEDSRSAS